MLSASRDRACAQEPSFTALQSADRMLLIEPNLVARRTLAVVIHELGMARVEEAADAQAAARHLEDTRYAALLIDLGRDQAAALDLITSVRGGQTACAQRMPVVAMSAAADPTALQRLKALDVQLLVRPFKVRTVLELLRAFQVHAA